MAIYYAKVSTISRGAGKSAVASAAYRAGEKIKNERDGIEHDYTKKTGIKHSEILTPENAPEWTRDREKLWNAVEESEKRKDARLAREIIVALPKELNEENQKELIRNYTKETFVSQGMIADIAIHDKGDGNPHAHILVTDRPITESGFDSKKNRDWNTEESLEKWRKSWANHANRYLEFNKISEKSYEKQGIEKIAQVHEGFTARKIERAGGVSDLCEYNRNITAKNQEIELINVNIKQLELQKSLVQEINKNGREEIFGTRSGIERDPNRTAENAKNLSGAAGSSSERGQNWDFTSTQAGNTGQNRESTGNNPDNQHPSDRGGFEGFAWDFDRAEKLDISRNPDNGRNLPDAPGRDDAPVRDEERQRSRGREIDFDL